MEPLSLLANLLLIVTIGTLMVALIAYMAYKLREKRKPGLGFAARGTDTEEEMVFLRPYIMPATVRESQEDLDTAFRP